MHVYMYIQIQLKYTFKKGQIEQQIRSNRDYEQSFLKGDALLPF